MRKISNKNIFYLLLAGIFVLLIMAYQLAIENTIKVHRNISSIEKKLREGKNAEQFIIKLHNKLKQQNQILGNGAGQNTNFQQRLLNAISNFSEKNNLNITNFPTPYYINQNNIKIETCTITLQGTFFNLLKLVKNINERPELGKIVSASFQIQKNLIKHRKKLFLQLYIRTINYKNKHDDET